MRYEIDRLPTGAKLDFTPDGKLYAELPNGEMRYWDINPNGVTVHTVSLSVGRLPRDSSQP